MTKKDILQKIIDNARTNPRKSLQYLHHPLVSESVSATVTASINEVLASALIFQKNTETALKRAAAIAAQWAVAEKAQEERK